MLRDPVIDANLNSITRANGPHWRHSAPVGWQCVLELDEHCVQRNGNEAELAEAVRCGADLRVGTGFRHHEHIELGSDCQELIHEFIDFRVTYLLDNQWSAGICNLRMPVHTPEGFGPRESMSFFLYNQNGLQALARPFLDGKLSTEHMNSCLNDFGRMTRFRELDRADTETNAPSYTFVYNFDFFKFCVNSRWREVLSHESDGTIISGSIEDLACAFRTGAEFKVAIRGLCADLGSDADDAVDHEVFAHLGSCYYYTERKLFMGATHPVVRVAPTIPLTYRSQGWDFGWLLPRTDGHVARWLCDPYTLKFRKSTSRHAIRWFVGT